MRKGRFSKSLIQFIIRMNVVFTAIVLAVFLITGNEPSTLVGAWFLFTGTELWNMSRIKQTKIKEGVDEDDCT